MRDLRPSDDDRIRLIHLADAPETVGEKRNFGCAHSAGEIICHWDDDDWSGPGRLQDQLERLMSTGLAVTGYHSMYFTDGPHWWKYEGERHYALGTSLCYRRAWWERHPFAALQVGEDNQAVQTAHSAGELATADAGELMYASIHPGNTSPRRLGDNWKRLENFGFRSTHEQSLDHHPEQE